MCWKLLPHPVANADEQDFSRASYRQCTQGRSWCLPGEIYEIFAKRGEAQSSGYSGISLPKPRDQPYNPPAISLARNNITLAYVEAMVCSWMARVRVNFKDH